jgi:hypothetical protein
MKKARTVIPNALFMVTLLAIVDAWSLRHTLKPARGRLADVVYGHATSAASTIAVRSGVL